MRRWLEPASTVTLAILVALALVLSSRLWSSPLISSPATALATAYLAPDAERVPAARTVAPLRIGWGLGDGRYTLKYPGTVEVDEYLWPLLARAAALVPADRLRAEDAGRLAVLRRAPGWSYAEATLPFAARLDVWQRLAAVVAGLDAPAEAVQGGAAEAVDVLGLFVGPDRALLAWSHPGGALVSEVPLQPAEDSPDPAAEAVRDAAGRLAAALQLVAGLSGDADAARLLEPPAGGLAVDSGILVPAQPPNLPIGQLADVPIDLDGYAGSFFGDTSLVRKIDREDVTVYSDGEATLSVLADGGSEYRRAGPYGVAGEDRVPDAGQGLEAVVTFAADRGGWPAGARLGELRGLRRPGMLGAPPYGWRYAFWVGFGGLPVRATGPWLAAEWVPEAPHGVQALQRRFVVVRQFPDFRLPTRSIEAILAAAAELPPEEVPPEVRRVRDAHLAYRVDENRLVLPVWVLRLVDGSRLVFDAMVSGPVPRYLGREAP